MQYLGIIYTQLWGKLHLNTINVAYIYEQVELYQHV